MTIFDELGRLFTRWLVLHRPETAIRRFRQQQRLRAWEHQ